MVARITAALVALVAATAAGASAIPRNDGSSCNTGSIQCCDSTVSSQDNSATLLASLLGLDIGGLTGLVGIQCSPIANIGLAATSCHQEPVCCENNSYGGLISLGCAPVSL
ncbi:fungal hydrophobin-domain-containing protein [Cubamyces lactineus]|nr:fungal hydrophobin-domain-containing protein [Cubamyces lactineus]